MRAGAGARVQRALWPKRRSQRTTHDTATSSPQPKLRGKCPMHDLPEASCDVCSWLALGKPSPEKGRDHKRQSKRYRSDSSSRDDLSPKRTLQSRRRRHSSKDDDDYDRAIAASLHSERLQAEGRTLDGQFAEPSKEWPPQHPGGYQSLKYFGIEVPTLVHPLDTSSGETFINDFGSQYNLDVRVIRYLLENEGVDCLERFRFAYSETLTTGVLYSPLKPGASRE